MRYLYHIALILMIGLGACTTEIEVDIPDPDPAIVVEGRIENGTPPFVLLTRNSAYFGGVDINNLEAYFVHDATMWVKADDGDSVMLVEWCIENFPEEFQRQIASSFGYTFSDSTEAPNICIYSVPNLIDYYVNGDTTVFTGEIHQGYALDIEVEGLNLSGYTTIPGPVPISGLSWQPHPDENNDSLVAVYAALTEPDTLGNFYRYWTQSNDEPTYAPVSGSVFDDKLGNGTQLEVPIERGQDPYAEIDFDVFSYFWKGDTVTMKLAAIDAVTYRFWRTLEDDGGDSPFSSPTIIVSNIDGGLGVWAGYGVDEETIIIPE